MALYRGETVRVVAVPKDPDTLDPLDPLPARAWVDLWRPGVDRTQQVPTIPNVEMTRDEENQRFYADLDTNGQQWMPGTWTYRVTAKDYYTSIEIGQFRLEA